MLVILGDKRYFYWEMEPEVTKVRVYESDGSVGYATITERRFLRIAQGIWHRLREGRKLVAKTDSDFEPHRPGPDDVMTPCPGFPPALTIARAA